MIPMVLFLKNTMKPEFLTKTKFILTSLKVLEKISYLKMLIFLLIDGFTKVTDKDAAVYTRKIALEEGIFVGNSAGAAIKGLLQLKEHFKPEDVVVVLFHDSWKSLCR